jgi:hypothetical protein
MSGVAGLTPRRFWFSSCASLGKSRATWISASQPGTPLLKNLTYFVKKSFYEKESFPQARDWYK